MPGAGLIASPPEWIELDGIRLELRAWSGEGVPVLLLHEGLGSVATWRNFPLRLAQASGRLVIAWSRQGHGESDPLPRAREPGYLHDEADRLPPLLDALGVARAHLLGHSDGASIALIAAARYPDRVSSLALEAPHVFVEPITVESIARVGAELRRKELVARLRRYHRRPDEVFRRWIDIWLDPHFRDWDIQPQLCQVGAPALLIQGLDDEYGTLAQLDRVEAALADTRRLELAKCGHSPHRDQPHAVLRAVADFLRPMA